MPTLKERLLLSETEFLSAVVEGGDALSTFEMNWENLLEDIDMANNTQQLDAETATLAHVVSLRLAVLADTSADLFSSYNSFTTQLMGDLTAIMSELSLSDSPRSPPVGRSPSLGYSKQLSPRKRRSVSPSIHTSNKRARVPSCSGASGDGIGTHESLHPVFPTFKAASSLPDSETPKISTPTTPSPPRRQSRKRRCSDADTSPPPLNAKRRFVGPRLHAVSDSFVTLRVPQDDETSASTANLYDSATTWCTPMPLSTSTVDSIIGENQSNGLEILAISFGDSMSSHPNDLDLFLDSLLASDASPVICSDPSSVSSDACPCILEDVLALDSEPELSDDSGSTASTPSPRSPAITPTYNPPDYIFYDPLLTSCVSLPGSCSLHDCVCHDSTAETVELRQSDCPKPPSTLSKPDDMLPLLDWNSVLEPSTWLSIFPSPSIPELHPNISSLTAH